MHLRRYRQEDCRLLYEWRNHPSIRKVCFNSNKFSYEAHQFWFKKLMANNETIAFILENNNKKPVGQIRFEPGDFAGSKKISIAVAPNQTKMGYGQMLLEKACNNISVKKSTIFAIAETKLDNLPSQKLFEKQNFVNLGISSGQTNSFYCYIKFLNKNEYGIVCKSNSNIRIEKAFKDLIHLIGFNYSENANLIIDLSEFAEFFTTDLFKFRLSIVKQIASQLLLSGDNK